MKKVDLIMLIDDDEATNFYHQIVLEDASSYNAILIFDAAQAALDYLRNETNPVPNIIFLDINMPLMNGWEFLEAIDRLDQKRIKEIVFVMLTASINESDKEKSKSFEKVTHFDEKPITKLLLSKVLDIF